jgi:hypothetical protein
MIIAEIAHSMKKVHPISDHHKDYERWVVVISLGFPDATCCAEWSLTAKSICV